MGEPKNALVEKSASEEEKPLVRRRRTPEDGRIITNIPVEFAQWMCDEAMDLGITPATMARMLLVEAFKARGLSRVELRERYKDRLLARQGVLPVRPQF